MSRSHSIFLCALSVCNFLTAQYINEQVFPLFPYKAVSTSIIPEKGGFYISGRTGQTTDGLFENWYTISQPYFIFSPAAQTKKITLFPANESGWFFGFGGNQNRISLSSVRADNDSFFAAWSNVDEEYTDVGPFIGLKLPLLHLSKYVGGSFDTVLTVPEGFHPTIAAGNNSTLHIVYEKVRPLDTSWGDRYSRFTSTILYQSRQSSGEISDSVQCGTGFYPSLKIKNGKQHLLFFQADSSNQIYAHISYARGTGASFESPVPLFKVFLNRGGPFSPAPPSYLEWDVDSAGGLHLVWRNYIYDASKMFIIHYSPADGISIDSLNDRDAVVRFSEQGIVKIMSAVQFNGLDSLRLDTYLSKQGSGLQKVHSAAFRLQGLLNQIIIGNYGSEHALITDGATSHLIKYSSTDSAQLILLSKEYSFNPGSYVDSTNRVWLAGKRDSTPVLLNFSLDDVGTHEDFVFPLRAGNEWHYGVYSDPPPPWPDYTDIQKIDSDTLMPNGLRYFVITAQMSPARYLRKDGIKIFQYNPADSTEHLRYDFSRLEGDTIFPKIVLKKIEALNIFGVIRRSFLFDGSIIPNSYDWRINIVDSIGIYSNEVLGPSWKLLGAKINGKIYGTPLSVDARDDQLPSTFSLSQNYPNPFNPSTTIGYQLPRSAFVTLKIYDLLGREVATLVSEETNAGVHRATWNAAQFSSGIYFARMTAGQFTATKKLLLMK